jgi:arylsulfatase A-like enzyme
MNYALGISILIIILIIVGIWTRKVHKRNIRMAGKQDFLSALKPNSLPKDAPNIIIILCDDLGYGDISCYDNSIIQTPNIDSIAENGVKFESFHSSAPICSPSRTGLLTGRYPVRAHVPMVLVPSRTIVNFTLKFSVYSCGMDHISPDEILLPEVLQKIGFKTGMLGKWHLGDHQPYLPNDFGFDFFYGMKFSNDMNPYHIYRNNQIEVKHPFDQGVITSKMTEEAVKFIEENKSSPFFLYYATPKPHNPIYAGKNFVGTSKAGLYGDVVQELDWSVGQIIEVLKKNNLFDNTIIAFTSDNGPWHEGNPGYHRGRKSLTFEGGSAVPMLVSWPAKVQKGQVNKELCSNLDFLPTILSYLGVNLPSDRIIDGKNILSLLMDPNAKTPYTEFYHFATKKIQAIRSGIWKYHIKHMSDVSTYFVLHPGPFLFKMDEDKNESYNQLMNH